MARLTGNEGMDGAPEALGYLARAWEFLWALRWGCVVLFADVWLSHRTGTGVVGLHLASAEAGLQAAGELLCAILAFALLMPLAVPAVCHVCEQLLDAFASPNGDRPATDYGSGHIAEHELRKYAHEHADMMALKIADTHLARFNADVRHRRQVATLVVGLVVLAVMDSPPVLPAQAKSLIGLAVTFAPWAPLLALLAAVAAFSLLRAC